MPSDRLGSVLTRHPDHAELEDADARSGRVDDAEAERAVRPLRKAISPEVGREVPSRLAEVRGAQLLELGDDAVDDMLVQVAEVVLDRRRLGGRAVFGVEADGVVGEALVAHQLQAEVGAREHGGRAQVVRALGARVEGGWPASSRSAR